MPVGIGHEGRCLPPGLAHHGGDLGGPQRRMVAQQDARERRAVPTRLRDTGRDRGIEPGAGVVDDHASGLASPAGRRGVRGDDDHRAVGEPRADRGHGVAREGVGEVAPGPELEPQPRLGERAALDGDDDRDRSISHVPDPAKPTWHDRHRPGP